MSVQTMPVAAELPRWDLSNVYPALDSDEFRDGEARLRAEMGELDAFLGRTLPQTTAGSEPQQVAHVLDEAVERFNSLYKLAGTRRAYITSFVTTDSRNTEAAKAVKYGGLDEVAALDLVTRNPARQLRVDQFAGHAASLQVLAQARGAETTCVATHIAFRRTAI